MKKIFKSFMFIAASAAAFASCQKEAEAPETKDTVKLIIHANVNNLANKDTKTYLADDGKTVLWGEGEYMTAALVSGGDFDTYTSKVLDEMYIGENQADFEFDVILQSGAPYLYGGIYPSSAVVSSSNTDASAFKVKLPDAQAATATQYDPSAYILIAKPEEMKSATTDWVASFRRATALNKISLTNLNDDIVKVTIIVPESKYLAGGRRFNLKDGTSGEIYNGGGRINKVDVGFKTALASATEKNVWFTSWGVEVAQGEELTVIASSTNFSYTRTITAREGGISFREGFLNTLTINMASAEKNPINGLDGNYLLLVKQSDKYYALSGEANGNRLNAVEFTGYDPSVEYSRENEILVTDGNLAWALSQKSSGNYTVKNGAKYLYYPGSDNVAGVREEEADMTINKEASGTYAILATGYTGRRLSKNSNNPYFAFYTGSGEKDFIIVPANYKRQMKTPVISYDGPSSTVSISAESDATIYYTIDGTVPSTSSTQYTEPFTISETVTVKAIAHKDGCDDSEVAAKECTHGSAARYYTKVTTQLDDYSGQFLILNTGSSTAFTGKADSDWGRTATVTVTTDGILSDETTDGYAVTIAKNDAGTAYTIMASDGNYITDAGDKKFKMGTTAGSVTITYENSVSKIKVGSCFIKFNSTGFRLYSGSTGTFSDLYMLEDNRAPQTLSFDAATGTWDMYTNTGSLPTLDASGAYTTIEYSSSDETVATVDASTGAITAKKPGPTTITATAVGDATYKKATAFYKLTITDSTPILTLKKENVNVSASAVNDAKIEAAYELAYATDSDVVVAKDGNITSASISSGTVTYSISANEDKDNTAISHIYLTLNGNKKTITITQAKNVTLPNGFEVTSYASVPAGWTASNTSNITKYSGYFFLGGGDTLTSCTCDLSSFSTATISVSVRTYGTCNKKSIDILYSTDGGTNWANSTITISNSYATKQVTINNPSSNVIVKFKSNETTNGVGARLQTLKLTGN